MAENTIENNEVTTNTSVETTQEQTREPERYVAPAVDIYEKDESLFVIADLPGLERDQIDISVDNNILTIKGTVPESDPTEFATQEFQPTSFYRQFRLGNRIDRSQINAELRHGVLKIHLPFAEQAKPRQVEV